MKNIIKLVVISLIMMASGSTASAQQENQAQVVNLQKEFEAMVESEVLGQASVGICARTGDGRTIVDVNADNMYIPASNMKLLSTGTALHALGGDYSYKTGIAYDGSIIEGVLMGDLFIIGGGDPTLGSKDSIAVKTEQTFALWEKMIRDAGISQIDGRVIGTSGDWFKGMMEEGTWMWGDIGTYYGAGVSGLMFYENVQSFEVSAGAAPGAAVNIKVSYPECPWMEFRYDCCTGKAGTGDQLYLYTSELAPVAEVRGTFAADKATKRVDCSNKYPELTCAHYFRNWLNEHGIQCTGEAADEKLRKIEKPDSLAIIGSSESPSLRRIAFETNHKSNNLYAETLLRTLGKELRQDGCYDSSYVAIRNTLKSLKVDTSRGLNIKDGSGLSMQNLVSPDFFCRYLTAMMSSPSFEDFAGSLPSPGGNGTLSYNMKNYPAATKERIKVKSGSMSGVRCYSGYIIPREGCKDETIVFSIMVNNCTAPTWKLRPLLDKMMGMLAEQN